MELREFAVSQESWIREIAEQFALQSDSDVRRALDESNSSFARGVSVSDIRRVTCECCHKTLTECAQERADIWDRNHQL